MIPTTTQVNETTIRDGKNRVLLSIDQNYILESEKKGDLIYQNFQRKRNDVRHPDSYLVIQVFDFIISRRHYPDQTLYQELNKDTKETPGLGIKHKTFAISVRDFKMQHCTKSGIESLFESPYSFRYHNFFELSVNSKKYY